MPASEDPETVHSLRENIFPTIYAIFQQARGFHGGLSGRLKVRNRTLRSLTRSCLYHRAPEQLLRTRQDAEELLSKYCRLRGVASPPSSSN